MDVARSTAWGAIAAAISLFAVIGFLQDLLPHNSYNWYAAAAIVGVAAAAILAIPPHSAARALLVLASLTIVSFLISYDVLDFMVDPIMAADWPIAIVAMLLALWLLVGVFAILVLDDE